MNRKQHARSEMEIIHLNEWIPLIRLKKDARSIPMWRSLWECSKWWMGMKPQRDNCCSVHKESRFGIAEIQLDNLVNSQVHESLIWIITKQLIRVDIVVNPWNFSSVDKEQTVDLFLSHIMMADNHSTVPKTCCKF